MENVQMLLPMEPKEFWRQLTTIVEQVVEQQIKKGTDSRNKHSDRPLLKASEVCEIFKISKPTIYEWLRQGKLKSIKIESRRYFLWQDIEELIKACRPAGTK